MATGPGWAPSQEKKRRRGREVDAKSDWFWEEAGGCEGESESNGEEEGLAEEEEEEEELLRGRGVDV